MRPALDGSTAFDARLHLKDVFLDIFSSGNLILSPVKRYSLNTESFTREER